LETQLEEEINQLLALGKKQDETESKSKVDIPEEIKRREDRLEKIIAAKKGD
jgi:hypothetical protein